MAYERVGHPEVEIRAAHCVSNFRVARQPPTIITWAELDFYDLRLIRPSGFVNRGRQGFPIKNWANLAVDGRGYGNHRMLSRFCLSE